MRLLCSCVGAVGVGLGDSPGGWAAIVCRYGRRRRFDGCRPDAVRFRHSEWTKHNFSRCVRQFRVRFHPKHLSMGESAYISQVTVDTIADAMMLRFVEIISVVNLKLR